MFQQSLNDSKRLSLSIATSANLSFDAELRSLPKFVEVTLEDLELEINNAELDNVFNEYQDQLKTLNSEYTEKLKTLNEQVETLSEIKAEKELLEKQLKETIEKVKIMESEKIDFRIKIGNLKEKLKVAEEDNESLKKIKP